MNFKWKIFLTALVLSLIPCLLISLFVYHSFKDSYFNEYIRVLVSDTRLIKERIEHDSASVDYSSIANEYDAKINARVTIIDPSGNVLADSRHDARSMENHSNRPEVIEALKGKIASWHRYSFTLTDDMLYAAMPVFNRHGELILVVRTASNTKDIESNLDNVRNRIISTALIIFVISMGLMYALFLRMIMPLYEISAGSERFSKGEFTQKIFPPRDRTLRMIADSLNRMASQLDEKLGIIEEQGNIQQAVLRSMKEGIIAVDYNERILLINQTTKDMLGVGLDPVHGKTLQEIVRISELQKFFKKVSLEKETVESEVILQAEPERSIQLSGTQLYDADSNAIGTLVVMNDITDLKYLDSVKKDLVANVSHELKTPVTTIKGFIETLRDGAIEDTKNAERFLDIVLKHIERLNLLIDDLLLLSRLEHKPGKEVLELEELPVKPILESVAEDYEIKAKKKKIHVEIQCPEALYGRINAHLLEQAIGNLLDNAIKYSSKKTKIQLGAESADGTLNIYVNDEGYGIAEEHIPRLFERFYRIDKARSREEGGTGLGLAIVKHLVNAMGGTIDVVSVLGKGTSFKINIPK